MAAPIGNTNATKGARWRHALEWALEHYADGDVSEQAAALSKVIAREKALRRIALDVVRAALKVTDNADDPELLAKIFGTRAQEWKFAVEEIGNRLDGKAAQSIALSGDADAPLALAVTFVEKDAS